MEVDTSLRFRMDPVFGGTEKPKKSFKKPPGQGSTEETHQMFDSCSTNLHCAICFGINALACQGCYEIAYCSRDHQIQHWPMHKNECKPLVLANRTEVLENLSLPIDERSFNPYSGMFQAARDVRPNDAVLHLQPIMHVAHNKGLPVPPDSILCLGCNRWYQLSQGYRCTKCKWPVCSERCEVDSCHAKFECQLFDEYKLYPPISTELYNGDVVLALRCLLLKDINPEDWAKLAAMEPVVEQITRPRHCLEADEKNARFLFYQCHFNERQDTSFQSIMNLLKVIDYCSIWLPARSALLSDKQFSFVSAKYVFPEKVFLAEECNPNCSWSLRHSPELKDCSIRVKASTEIRAGAYFSVCFTGISEFGATFPKRYENCRFLFRCRCSRCLDPTECGSFFSGMKCPQCDDPENGYLLPKDPSGDGSGSWKCFNKDCEHSEDGTQLLADINTIHQEIIDNTSSLQGLLSLISKHEKIKLHPNHYLIMKSIQLCIDLCWGICQNSALHVISSNFLNRAKALTEKLMKIYKHIYPRHSVPNAKLLFHHQLLHGVARVRELLWMFQQDKLPIDDQYLWPNEFWEILDVQKTALEVLLGEPPGSVERENAILMKGVLEDTESLLVLELRNKRIQYETLMGLQKIYSRYCSRFLYSVLPIFEDKELNEFKTFTGPYCKDLVDKTQPTL